VTWKGSQGKGAGTMGERELNAEEKKEIEEGLGEGWSPKYRETEREGWIRSVRQGEAIF